MLLRIILKKVKLQLTEILSTEYVIQEIKKKNEATTEFRATQTQVHLFERLPQIQSFVALENNLKKVKNFNSQIQPCVALENCLKKSKFQQSQQFFLKPVHIQLVISKSNHRKELHDLL